VSSLAVAALLTAAAAAGAANAYFDYVPTVGALLGRTAHDQASRQALARATLIAQHSTVPPLPAHGMVETVDIPGVASGFQARSAQIYLPPIWFARQRPALPVIVLLHGTPGAPSDWTRAGGVDVIAERWAAPHGKVAPILVMPDENGAFTADTECVDGSRGRAEQYLTEDVPNWVLANLGAAPAPSRWAIGGASEGGYCALDLGLRHPERFGTLLDFSGLDRPTVSGGALKLFGGSRSALADHTPALILRRPNRSPSLAAWFEVGGADGGTTRAVLRMAALAQHAGIDTHLVVAPHAHHTWRVFRSSFADAFPWVATRLGADGPGQVISSRG
jgi:S-formylglutathione hydrolase FrmB